ncbi:PaaI family thioesterase [bacterium AH-315-B15]|nr:PaaI family thioesterase [bacterium AH-315-B15]
MNHFERLMQMYQLAPIHESYPGIQILVEDKVAEVSLDVDRRYFHAGEFAHGAIYFKLLDDCCYFACQSVETSHFLVTTNLNVNLMRPIFKEKIIAKGRVDFISANLFTATGELFNEKGKLCGTAQASFMRSKGAIEDVEMYNRG